MHPSTYQTVSGKELQRPARPPQSSQVPINAAAAKFPSCIQHHAAQM